MKSSADYSYVTDLSRFLPNMCGHRVKIVFFTLVLVCFLNLNISAYSLTLSSLQCFSVYLSVCLSLYVSCPLTLFLSLSCTSTHTHIHSFSWLWVFAMTTSQSTEYLSNLENTEKTAFFILPFGQSLLVGWWGLIQLGGLVTVGLLRLRLVSLLYSLKVPN